MRYAPRIQHPLRRGARAKLQVVGPGWLRGELLAITLDRKRVVTLLSRRTKLGPGDLVVAKIVHDKDGIFIAKPL